MRDPHNPPPAAAREGRAWASPASLAMASLACLLLLAACGGSSAGSSAPSRPIVISSTATPGPPPPTPAGGPADPNSTVLTPYPTTPPTQAPTPPAASAQAGSAAASPATNQVRIQDFGFTPTTLTVTVGTQVTWLNAGPSNHTATANDGSFDSGTIQRNGNFAFTFSKAGTFAYHCSIHPTMTGTVTVT